MKLVSIELRRIRLPLVTPFATALGQQREREALLVRAITPGSEGWGECTAMSEPLYTSEYLDGAHQVTKHHLLPRLLRAQEISAGQVAGALSDVKGHRMAKGALEMAVLDAELRLTDASLAQHLGAVRHRVEAGATVGIVDSVGELVERVQELVQLGYRRVKLKIKPGWDKEPIRAVREAVDDGVMLLADANGAYTTADAAHLAQLDQFKLAMIEQPLPAPSLADHAELAKRLTTPICLDESITSASSTRDAIAMGAAAVVNVKAGRVGGYLEARRVHDVCMAAGVPVWCGGMLETGLGRAANLALASLPGFSLPGDLSASDRYYHRDLTPPIRLEDGHLQVPTGAGLGVEVSAEVLEECTTFSETVTDGDYR